MHRVSQRCKRPDGPSHRPGELHAEASNGRSRRWCAGRRGVGLALLLVAAGWVASEIELPGEPAATDMESGWRRTAEGWEWSGTWQPHPPPFEPSLHPAVVCSLQVLLSTLALVALPARRGQRQPVAQRHEHFDRPGRRKKSPRRASAAAEPQLR